MRTVETISELRSQVNDLNPEVVLVNLDAAGDGLPSLEGLARKKSSLVVGYYSHVNVGLAQEARRMGFDVVLPRGSIVGKLQQLLEATLRNT